MIEGPVLVTVVPANTANGVAVPNPTEDWACVDAVCVNCPQSINERLRPVSTLAKNWIAEN